MVRRAGWVKAPPTDNDTYKRQPEPAAVTMDDAAASVPTFRRSSNNQRHIEVINQSINRLTSIFGVSVVVDDVAPM